MGMWIWMWMWNSAEIQGLTRRYQFKRSAGDVGVNNCIKLHKIMQCRLFTESSDSLREKILSKSIFPFLLNNYSIQCWLLVMA
jgi:hypothetical protein